MLGRRIPVPPSEALWTPRPMRALPASVCLATVVLTACGAPSTTLPQPCAFLTQTIAAQITGDAAISSQGNNVTESLSGYVACIFADPQKEANNVTVQIKMVTRQASRSTLQAAAAFFSRGEPVAPFQTFPAVGVGDDAVGESTLGVAFIVFSKRDVLVYVGAGSPSRSASSLQVGIEALAKQVAAAM